MIGLIKINQCLSSESIDKTKDKRNCRRKARKDIGTLPRPVFIWWNMCDTDYDWRWHNENILSDGM